MFECMDIIIFGISPEGFWGKVEFYIFLQRHNNNFPTEFTRFLNTDDISSEKSASQ